MSKDLPPSRTAEQFVVRFPGGMRDRIKTAADENGRSMNAEIVYMVQSHFDRLDDQAAQLGAALHAEKQNSISIGLADPGDRTAVLKVLLLEELMLLKRRVNDLGGRDAVLKAPKAEIVQQIEGPRIKGTQDERQSYFSRIVGEMPLTALLTDAEIERLASRVVSIQSENERLAFPKKPSL